jgi:hypothetical protein
MNFLPLPYRRWSIASAADEAVLRQRMRGAVAALVFQGDVHVHDFSVTRFSEDSRSSAPTIAGEFHPQQHGTEVRLRMYPRAHGLWILAALLLYGVLYGRPAFDAWRQDGTFTPDAKNMGLVLLVYYLYTMGRFVYETRYVKRELIPRLQASVQPDELRSAEPAGNPHDRPPGRIP